MFVYEGKIRKKNPIKFYEIKANPTLLSCVFVKMIYSKLATCIINFVLFLLCPERDLTR